MSAGRFPGLWRFCLFPAVTMSLGWGLRGFIGGGPLGAMIPGALVALSLCLLLDEDSPAAARIAAFGAVGVGFGGEMTYGQTVGFILQPATFWFGLAGLSLKGAIWGLLGGAVLGAGFAAGRIPRKTLLCALALVAAGAHLGWKWINEPKLIYFSNRLDRPRPEIWAGLLIGALLVLALLARAGHGKIPGLFGLAGALGGGIGFGLGGALQALGRSLSVDHRWFDWWKLMEFTFGFLFGLALGVAAWMQRAQLRDRSDRPSAGVWKGVLGFAAAGAALIWVESNLGLRYSYALGACLLLGAVLFFRPLAWQTAIAIPYCAFALDLAEYFYRERKLGDPLPAWVFVVASSLALSYRLARRETGGGPMTSWSFQTLMWTAVAVSWLKSALHPWPPSPGHIVVELLFTAAAIALSWTVRRVNTG